MTQRYGASAEEWNHFSLWLGLGGEMLPVVSNPNAKIAPESQLKTIGKVPSKYNAQRLAVGIAHWTTIAVHPSMIDKWSKDDDLGFCLRTRSIRFLDLDISNPGGCAKIRARLGVLLGVLPVRARPGSARVGLAFELEPGNWKKRVIAVRGGGAIEFLADGQQFVAAGTHPAGGRYFWEGGLPNKFPNISAERFESAWAELEREFGVPGIAQSRAFENEPARRGVVRPVVAVANGHDRGSDLDTSGPQRGLRASEHTRADPVGIWLERRGWVVEGSRDERRLFVACPWEDTHTVDTGASATAWFLAGTGGYEQGHFECLHAHCAGRSDAAFLEAVGYEQSFASDFAVVVADSGGRVDGGSARSGNGVLGLGSDDADPTAAWAGAGGPGSGLTRSKKGWQATASNLVRALQTPGWWRRIAWDHFRQELMWAPWSGNGGGAGQLAGVLVPWRNEDYLRTRVELERRGFEPMGRELLRDAVALVGKENAFDSAADWVRGLVWDGVSRVESFLETQFAAAPSAYSRAVSTYLWTALAGRALVPGVKADMVVILHSSQQGKRKSSAIEALAPVPEAFTTLDLAERDAELSRRLRGCLVAELVELRGLGARDHEAVNAWVTQRADRWTPKYEEIAITVPRRFLMIGSTNRDDFLSDATGNRRWLPVTVQWGEAERIARDRDQLWAEGAYLFEQGGVAWADAERLAQDEHETFEMEEIGFDAVRKFVTETSEKITLEGVLQNALGYDPRTVGRQNQVRVANILRRLGFQKHVGKDDDRKSFKYWSK